VSNRVPAGLRPVLHLLVCTMLLGALPAPRESHPTAITLVVRPWAEATIDGGEPFTVPATLLLEPGDYRLILSRRGYRTVETVLSVEGRQPQHHLYVLERR
jgi:hypothetical protein